MDDAHIVDLYLERNEDAVKHTKEKYGAGLRSVSFGIIGNRQSAEECENDTYLSAWNSIPPHEPRSYLYAFLLRIVRHLSLNVCRNERRVKRSGEVMHITEEMEQCVPSGMDPSLAADASFLSDLISQWLLAKPKEQRILFMRRYWYMDSLKDASRKAGMKESNAKTILFRMRKELKAYLEKEGYDHV